MHQQQPVVAVTPAEEAEAAAKLEQKQVQFRCRD
jgi:hypothetical protein